MAVDAGAVAYENEHTVCLLNVKRGVVRRRVVKAVAGACLHHSKEKGLVVVVREQRRLVAPVHYRSALKVLPTPVVAVCALDSGTGEPHGMLVGSFRALSSSPPLVSFNVGRSSRTWARVSSAGRLGVSVLASDQRMVSRSFESRGDDKFRWVRWHVSGTGVPRLDGAVSWMDVDIRRVLGVGDHLMVIAAPVALAEGAGVPLVARSGGLFAYRARTPGAAVSVGTGGFLDHGLADGGG